MTGRYNVRNYVNFGTLSRSETTFAHLLQKAGYATAICGKWQLGREPDSPRHFGFEESLLWQHTRRPPRYANPGLERNGAEEEFPAGSYGPQLINDFAIDFVTRNKDKPFFLYYPMVLTHDPFQPTPDSSDWDPQARGEKVNREVKHFADMTAFMDKLIGRLDSHLHKLGIREHTLLIFLGDNGTHSSVTTRFQGREYQGGKGKSTRNGTHVPLIISWPAVIQKKQVHSDLVSSVDFLPTLCEAAGVTVPARLDGISFLPRLRGEQGEPRQWLYSWYSPRQGNDLMVKEWAFDHHYKLYRSGEFFDLRADPAEKNPIAVDTLSGEAATAAQKLENVLEQFENARPAESPKPKRNRKKPS